MTIEATSYSDVVRVHRGWGSMKRRCENPDDKGYKNYGGRGIYVCDEWQSFDNFADWMYANGTRRGRDQQIDRIDNDGPYSPENCQLVSALVNSRNRRNSRTIVAFGETKSPMEWSKDLRAAVGYDEIKRRVFTSGWDPEEAITVKHRRNRVGMTCSKGHPRTEENTYRRKNGDFRVCKICAKQRARDAYHRNKQAARTKAGMDK